MGGLLLEPTEKTNTDSDAHPVVGPGSRLVAVGPDVVILVVRVSGAAQVEPVMLVAGVVGDEIHDQIQTWWKQNQSVPAARRYSDPHGKIHKSVPLLCISARSSSKSCMVPNSGLMVRKSSTS